MKDNEQNSRLAIGSVIDESGLSPVTRAGLKAITASRLEAWSKLIEEEIGSSNPRFHFTTSSFRYTPDSLRDRQRFLSNVNPSWTILVDEKGGFVVDTGIVEGILTQGLKPRSCVVTAPEGPNDLLVRSHPRLLGEAFRKTILSYGKHAVPYKQPAIRRTHGTLDQIVGALVVLEGDVSADPKGKFPRLGLTDGNLLKPRTHLISEGEVALARAVVKFPISQSVYVNGGHVMIDRNAMVRDVFSGIRSHLRDSSRWTSNRILNYLNLLGCFKLESANV